MASEPNSRERRTNARRCTQQTKPFRTNVQDIDGEHGQKCCRTPKQYGEQIELYRAEDRPTTQHETKPFREFMPGELRLCWRRSHGPDTEHHPQDYDENL